MSCAVCHVIISLLQEYVLEVNWSEGSSTTVYRKYSDFFEFQVSDSVWEGSVAATYGIPVHLQCFLLEKFPLEAGDKDPAQRMIPFLPGTYITLVQRSLVSWRQGHSTHLAALIHYNDLCLAFNMPEVTYVPMPRHPAISRYRLSAELALVVCRCCVKSWAKRGETLNPNPSLNGIRTGHVSSDIIIMQLLLFKHRKAHVATIKIPSSYITTYIHTHVYSDRQPYLAVQL